MSSENEPISLEDYFESFDDLPTEVRNGLKVIRDFDEREQSIMKEIHRIDGEFLKIDGKATPEQRKEHADRIRGLFNKVNKYGDDQVQWANTTSKKVAQNIKQLDSDLAKLTIEKKKTRKSTAAAVREKRKQEDENEPKPSTSSRFIQETFDRNEPTYCICGDVEYGSMVACDNKECEVEWFHYDCVGLSSAPDGDWHCPLCRVRSK